MGLILLNGTAYSGYDEPPCVYSEEEREIGVWIDGKPLYQKTIHIVESTEKSDVVYTTEITSLNPDYIKLVNAEVKLGSNGNNRWYTAPFNVNYTYYMGVSVCNSEMEIISNTWKYSEAYITIQYTKTTDTPGSGKWASNGALAKHYSLQEQVIGTWIDGKPLYERVIYLNNLQINTNWTSTSYCEPIDKVVKADLIDSYNQHFTCEVGLDESQTPGYYDVLLSTRYPSGSGRTFNYLILQYTKTTD